MATTMRSAVVSVEETTPQWNILSNIGLKRWTNSLQLARNNIIELHRCTHSEVAQDELLSPSAYKLLGLPDASQLANFHQAQCTLPATLTSPHLTGAGIGGQFAHRPFSYVASRFIRKNGTTSNVPALVTVFLPQALKTAAASCASVELGAGAEGRSPKEAIVVISWWKWWLNGSWKEDMIRWSSAPENASGLGRLVRYFSYSARPVKKDSNKFLDFSF
jgi:hypothetical protein